MSISDPHISFNVMIISELEELSDCVTTQKNDPIIKEIFIYKNLGEQI